MRMESMFKIIEILKYIRESPNIDVPNIRDLLGITHSDPPSQKEKTLYKLVSMLSKQGYIEKKYFKKRELGGAHFSLNITQLGLNFFNKLSISTDSLDHSERTKLMEKLESSIRLVIWSTLKGKISKPIMVEIVPELSHVIMESISSTLEKISFISN